MQRKFRMIVTLVMVLALILNTFIVSPVAKASSGEPNPVTDSIQGVLADNPDPIEVWPTGGYADEQSTMPLFKDSTGNLYTAQPPANEGEPWTLTGYTAPQMPQGSAGDLAPDLGNYGDAVDPNAVYSDVNTQMQVGGTNPLSGSNFVIQINFSLYADFKSKNIGIESDRSYIELPIPTGVEYVANNFANASSVISSAEYANGVVRFYIKEGLTMSEGQTYSATVTARFPNYITPPGTPMQVQASFTDKVAKSPNPSTPFTITSAKSEAWVLSDKATTTAQPQSSSPAIIIGGREYVAAVYTIQTNLASHLVGGFDAPGRYLFNDFYVEDTLPTLPQGFTLPTGVTDSKPILQSVTADGGATVSVKDANGNPITLASTLEHGSKFRIYGSNPLLPNDVVNEFNKTNMLGSGSNPIATKGTIYTVTVLYPKDAFTEAHHTGNTTMTTLTNSAELKYQFKRDYSASSDASLLSGGSDTAPITLGWKAGQKFGNLVVNKKIIENGNAEATWPNSNAHKPTFKVYNATTGAQITADADGVNIANGVQINNGTLSIKLNPGDYFLEEVAAGEYAVTADIGGSAITLGKATPATVITIVDQQTVTVKVVNTANYGFLKVTKYKCDNPYDATPTKALWNTDKKVTFGLYTATSDSGPFTRVQVGGQNVNAVVGTNGIAEFTHHIPASTTLTGGLKYYVHEDANLDTTYSYDTTLYHPVTIVANQTATVDGGLANPVFLNTKKLGKITVTKNSSYSPVVGLQGAVFEVYNAAITGVNTNGTPITTGTLQATLITLADGTATTPNYLATGMYWVFEKTAPTGHGFSNPRYTSVVVTDSKTTPVAVAFANPRVGTIEVTKAFGQYLATVSTSVVPKGSQVTFKLYYSTTNPSHTVGSLYPSLPTGAAAVTVNGVKTLTDTNLKATWTLMQPGFYWVEETACDPYFTKMSGFMYLGEIKNDKDSLNNLSGTVTNPPARGKISLKKVGRNGSDNTSDVPLDGIPFNVYKKSTFVSVTNPGPLVHTMTTDANGNALSWLLDAGDYVVVEGAVPTKHNAYEKDRGETSVQYVTVKANEITPLAKTVVNPKTSRFRIIKKGEGASEIDPIYGKTTDWVNLPGVSFQLFYNLPTGTWTPESAPDTTWTGAPKEIKDAALYKLMGEIAAQSNHAQRAIYYDTVIMTGPDGSWTGRLPAGRWYIREIYNDVVKAEGYVEREVIYAVDVTDNGEVTIYNILDGGTGPGSKYNLGLVKQNASGTKLAGAEFYVWQWKGTGAAPTTPTQADIDNGNLVKVKDIGQSAALGTFVQMVVASDKDGRGLSKALTSIGTYYLEEKQTPPPTTISYGGVAYTATYRVQYRWLKVEVTATNGTPVVVATNVLNNAIKIKKVGTYNSGATLNNITFRVYNKADVTIGTDGYAVGLNTSKALDVSPTSKDLVTGTNGEAMTHYLFAPGEYYVIEHSTDTKYIPAKPMLVEITDVSGQVITAGKDNAPLTFINTNRGQLVINKLGGQTSVKINGVKFIITRVADATVIKADGTIDGTPTYYTGFTQIKTAVTANGQVTSVYLDPGKYEIKEDPTTVQPGFDPTTIKPVYVEILKTVAPGAVTVKNDELSTLQVKKVNSVNTSTTIDGAKFMLFVEDTTVGTFKVAQQYSTAKPPVLQNVSEITTANSGVAEWTNLPAGTYYVGEISTHADYVIDPDEFKDGSTTYNNQTVRLRKVVVDYGHFKSDTSANGKYVELFKNDPVKAGLTIIKQDGSGNLLGGAEFKVWKMTADGNTKVPVMNTTASDIFTTPSAGANKGKIFITDVKMVENGVTYTQFYVEEIKAPAGFQLKLVNGKNPNWTVSALNTSNKYISVTLSDGTNGYIVNEEKEEYNLTASIDKSIVTGADTTLTNMTVADAGLRKVRYDITKAFAGANANLELYDFTLTDDDVKVKMSNATDPVAYDGYDIQKVLIHPAYNGSTGVPVKLMYTLDGKTYLEGSTYTANAAGGADVVADISTLGKVLGIQLIYGTKVATPITVLREGGNAPESYSPYVVGKNFFCEGFAMDVLYDQKATSLIEGNVTDIRNTAVLKASYYRNGNVGTLEEIELTDDDTVPIELEDAQVVLPKVQLTKGILNPKTEYQADDLVEYALTVTNLAQSTSNFVSPIVADFLPAGMVFNTAATTGYSNTNFNLAIAGGVTPVLPTATTFTPPTSAIGKNGEALSRIMWEFPSFELEPGASLTITYKAKVSRQMTSSEPKYTNEAFLGSALRLDPAIYKEGLSFTSNLAYYASNTTDSKFTFPELAGVDTDADVKWFGEETMNWYIRVTQEITAKAAESMLITKEVRGDEGTTSPWRMGTDTAKTTVGGNVEFRVTMFNNSPTVANHVRLVDNLPKDADFSINAPTGDRGSDWRPILTGVRPTVTVGGSAVSGAKVYYTTSTDAAALKNPLTATNVQATIPGYVMWPASVWTEWTGNLTADVAKTVTAVGFDLGDYKLASAASAIATIPMTAPVYDDAFAAFYKLAINDSMMYNDSYYPQNSAGRQQGTGGVTTGSNISQITLYPEPVKLGDLVWMDLNANGVQDTGEPGIVGATVTLKTRKNGGDWTTKTFTGGTDTDGKYLFEGLIPNVYTDANRTAVVTGTDNYEYQVEFGNIPAGYKLTIPEIGTGTTPLSHLPWAVTESNNSEAINSDGVKGADDATTWLTPIFGLDVKQYYGTAKEVDNVSNLTLDIGFTPPVALGDYVWEDVDRDGIQDADEPGINGITVTLEKKTGTDTYTSTFNDVLGQAVASQLTRVDPNDGTKNGYYFFDNLPVGTYRVTFTSDARDDYWFSEGLQGRNRAVDSNVITTTENKDADGKVIGHKTGVTGDIVLNPTTQDLANLQPGETFKDLTIDAGLYRKGIIGDFVWYDANANGIQETEEGVEGQTVFLVPEGINGTFRPLLKAALATSNGTSFNNSGTVMNWLAQQEWSTLQSTKTDATGWYIFEDVKPGKYRVYVVKDEQYIFSPDDQGTLETDSNTNVLHKGGVIFDMTPVRAAASDEFTFDYKYYDNPELMEDLTWDFGVYEKVSVGDYVWHDLNYDGIQNDTYPTGDPDTGVNGVTVTLFKNDGTSYNTTFTDINDKAVPTQLTRANAGKNGWYLFDNLKPGDYKVEFDITGVQYKDADNKLHDYYFTLANEGTDEALDSDVDYTDIATRKGESDKIDLVATIEKTFDPYLKLDAGLVVPASLGDYVWEDTDYDGIQDTTEAGIEKVKVELRDEAGNLVTKDFFGNAIPDTATDVDGFYEFTKLAPRNGDLGYTVRFYRPDGTNGLAKYDFFTYHDVGSDDAIDSDANYDLSTATPAVAGKNETKTWADSAVATLVSAQHDPTLDAGLVQYAAIGNYVWYDINRNGIQDTTEQPVNNVRVELLDENGNLLRSMNTGTIPTNTAGNPVTVAADGTMLVDGNGNAFPGFYYFGELVPTVNYIVRFVRPLNTIYDEFTLTDVNQNTQDELDADGVPTVDHATATTGKYAMMSGEYNDTVDEGLVVLLNLGDRVWFDTIRDNWQNNSALNTTEPGVGGVAVALYRVFNGMREATPIATTSTDANGYYIFTRLLPGDYQVRFLQPGGYTGFVTPNVGNDRDDSDASPVDGFTHLIPMVDQDDMTIDAGLYRSNTPPTPTPTGTPNETPTPPTPPVPYGLPVITPVTPPYGLPTLDTPPYGLPKTGESWTTAFGMIALGILMVGVGIFLMQGRKKDEQEV